MKSNAMMWSTIQHFIRLFEAGKSEHVRPIFCHFCPSQPITKDTKSTKNQYKNILSTQPPPACNVKDSSHQPRRLLGVVVPEPPLSRYSSVMLVPYTMPKLPCAWYAWTAYLSSSEGDSRLRNSHLTSPMSFDPPPSCANLFSSLMSLGDFMFTCTEPPVRETAQSLVTPSGVCKIYSGEALIIVISSGKLNWAGITSSMILIHRRMKSAIVDSIRTRRVN